MIESVGGCPTIQPLELFRNALDAFESTRQSFARAYGAMDSEPRHQLCDFWEDQIKFKKPQPPGRVGMGWDLYRNEPGVNRANQELDDRLMDVVRCYENLPIRDAEKAVEILKYRYDLYRL